MPGPESHPLSLLMRPAAQGLAARAAIIAGGLAAASAFPPAAVLFVWPLLFFVPGWCLVHWTGLRLSWLERVGLAIIVSVAVSAHVVYWTSVLIGRYDRLSIVVASALMAAPLLAWWPFPVTGMWHRLATVLRRERSALLIVALPTAFVGGMLSLSIWTVDGGGVRTSAVLWSDLLVHLSIAQSVNAANFPPEVPYYAGAPLTYHWFSDFHAAIASAAAGIFPIATFVVANSLLTASLSLLVFGLARRMTGSRRAALLAVILATLGGGLGYIRFFMDWTTTGTNPLELLTTRIYDNQWLTGWPYFSIPSVMGTGLLSHRATTAGLPLLAACILLVVVSLPPRRARGLLRRPDSARGLLIAGLVAALSAPFHFFFFPALLLLVAAYVVVAGRLVDAMLLRNASAFLAPLVLALPFVVTPFLVASGGNRIQFRLWWDAPVADGPAAVVFFYVTNLGVPAVLAVGAFLAGRTPGRSFLAAWALAMFVIPNIAVFNAISFDMNKYFQAMWIAVAILAGWTIRRWAAPALGLALAFSVAAPVQVGVYGVFERYGLLSATDLAAAEWAASATPPRSVFVTDGWLHSFTDVAGRLRVMTFPPYIGNLGYDPTEREAALRTVYCEGDVRAAVEAARKLGADYIVDAGRPGDCRAPVSFGSSSELRLAFEEGSMTVWEISASTDQSD